MIDTKSIDRRDIFNGFVFVVIVLVVAAVLLLPKGDYQGIFLYPAIFFYWSPIFYVGIFLAIEFIVWNVERAFDTQKAAQMIVMALVIVPCLGGLWLMVIFYFWMAHILPAHFASTHFQNHTYYLAHNTAAGSGFEYNNDNYLVYECDNVGIICRSPVAASIWNYSSSASPEDRVVQFIVEGDALYVTVDGEQFPVQTSGG